MEIHIEQKELIAFIQFGQQCGIVAEIQNIFNSKKLKRFSTNEPFNKENCYWD
jgi:hypothetical protein